MTGLLTPDPADRPSTPLSISGLRAGAVVGGYRLLRRLGAGGMGVVWEVADAEGHHVAMKILHPQIAADPMARRRLDREASVLARVKDSRVARILDIETGDGADGSGVTFVITEMVDGPTLQHEVDHEGVYDLSTDARDLADLAHGLVDSLKAVHAAGVIHRDLKPSNVMLGAQGPVLIDFGIAQVADDVRLTQTGQVTGTPGFIPPEMLDGGDPTPEVDWYACAGVLLYAITGRAPFGSGPWQAVFRRVYGGTPELADLEEEYPALARVFTAALAPEVADRAGIEDLLAVLDEVADGGTGENAAARALGRAGATAPRPLPPSAGSAAGAPAQGGPAPSGTYGYMSAPVPRSYAPASASGATGAIASVPPTGAPGARPPAGQAPPAFAPATGQVAVQGSQTMVQPAVGQAAPPAHRTAQPAQPQYAPQTGLMPATQVGGVPGAPTGQVAESTGLPDWAREPERHRAVVAAVGCFLMAMGLWLPGWAVLVGAVLVVVAGAVGRADDARRWRRVQRGGVGSGDNVRMWVASPWYLVRSVLAAGGAAVVGAVLVVLSFYFLAPALGFTAIGFGSVAALGSYYQAGLATCAVVSAFLLVVWFVPWGAPTRRGGARLVETVARTASTRLLVGTVLLAASAGMVLLFALFALPVVSLAPFSFS